MTDRVEKWKADYAAGLSTHKIAVKHGVGQTTVWNTLRAAGVSTARPQAEDYLDVPAVIAAYRVSPSMRIVAEQFGTTIDIVRRILQVADVARTKPPAFPTMLKTLYGLEIGKLSVLVEALPDEDRTALVREAVARGKTIAEVLVEDWEAE